MPEPVVEIPNRPAFRASEVCEIAQIPPYVLKSWEKEFPGLGVSPKPGGARVYRRADVEQVMRIKHLLFAEGLTLAGARRRIEGEPKIEDEPLPDLALGSDVRDKVSRIKQELRGLLDLLSAPPVPKANEPTVAPPAPEPAVAPTPSEHAAAPTPSEHAVAPTPSEHAAAPTAPEPAPADLPLLDGVTEVANPSGPLKRRRTARR